MKSLLSILIFFGVNSNAQVVKENTSNSSTSKNIPGLSKVFPIDTSQTTTTFSLGRGFEGITLVVRSDGTFKQSLFSCDGKEPLDSGAWKISDNRLLIGRLSYELFQYESLYYLIENSQKKTFLKDIRQAVTKAKRDSGAELSFVGKVLWALRDDYFMKAL